MTVWKYAVPFCETAEPLEMPEAPELLAVGSQTETDPDDPRIEALAVVIWARVDPNRPTVRRLVYAVPTGAEVDPGHRYVGTTVLNYPEMSPNGFVAHVFDGGPA